MPLARRVEKELLDELPANDRRAIHSRADLLRVNSWMGNAGILAQALAPVFERTASPRLLELGSGDGRLLLKVAQKLGPRPQGRTELLLLDQQNIVSTATISEFARLGWEAHPIQADVLEWLEEAGSQTFDGVLCNLFLHHFPPETLRVLFSRVSTISQEFWACEPRRGPVALAAVRLLGLIGCNQVTRHDALLSVNAGFCGGELSQLWPAGTPFELREHPARLFSHFFEAHRRT